MTNTMTYKGHSAHIEYDDEDCMMTGQIAGIRDGVGFHADSVEELKKAFYEAVDDYVDTLISSKAMASSFAKPVLTRPATGQEKDRF